MSTTQNELNAIIECLKITYTSSDMNLRLQAEEKLSLLESNIVSYTKLFIQAIIKDKTLDSRTKLAIALQLKRTIVKYIATQTTVNTAETIEIIKAFVEALITSGLEAKLTQNLSDIFKSLLNSLEESPEILTQFSIYLCQILNSNTIPYESFKGVLIIFSSIILCCSFTKKNDFEIFNQLIPFTKSILQIEYDNIQRMIVNIEQQKNIFIEYNKTIAEVYGLYFTCSFKLKSKATTESKAFLDKSFEEIAAIGIKHLFTVIPNYVPHPPIAWSNDKDIDLSINKTKTQILRFICSIMSSLPDTISDKGMLDIHIEMIKRIATNLEYIVLNKYKDIHLMNKANDHKYTLFISQMILYINKALARKTIRNEFNRDFEPNFFKNIALPLLVITQAEINQSITEPGDYSVLLEDAMFNHTNKTIKSATCQLLKTLTTASSSSEEFISRYMMELFDSVFNVNSHTDRGNQLMTINDFIVKINLSQETRLDLCLLVFSILKGCFRNKQIEIEFCSKTKDYFHLLFSEKAQEYIKHKLCIALSQYFTVFQSIDDDSNALTISCIQYLFHNIFLENNYLVAEEATQTLNGIILESKSIYKLHRPLINHLFVEIIKIIPKTIIANVFDVIYQIRSNTESTELDFQLFVALCNRISVEAAHKTRLKFKIHPNAEGERERTGEEAQSKVVNFTKPDHEFFITKCFNIIRYLVNEEKFVANNLQVIETNLKPLLFYMKNPVNIDFDEDIILIMINLIKYTKTIPSLGYELMPELHKYVIKCKGMINDIFELVNLYIIYGSSIIEQNEVYCKAILEVFKYGSNDDKFNESPFYVSLLIHLWLFISSSIQPHVVIEFLMSSINSLVNMFSWVNDPLKKAELSEAKYSFVGCLLVIYASFVNYPSICLTILNSSDRLPQLLQWTEYCLKLKVIAYPIKMLVLSLSKVINLEYFINDNAQFINFSLKFLLNQQSYESFKLKNSTNQKGFKKYDYQGDDEDEDNDNDDNALEKNNGNDEEKEEERNVNDEADLETLIANLMNPYKNTDEFKEFKLAIERYKNNHPQQFNQWFEGLSDFDKDKLNKILLTVRIDFVNKANLISIPRKIVKVKRNNA